MNLADFLREHASKLEETDRFRTLSAWAAYKEGTQYAARKLDVNGYLKDSPGMFPYSGRVPPWNERDIPAVWNLWQEVTSELTDWAVAGENWCRLTVADDEAAEDWLTTVANRGNLPDVIAEARDWAGAVGTAVVAFSVRRGLFQFEALNPVRCWPLEWEDEVLHRPAAVAMVYEAYDPFTSSQGSAGRPPLLHCRYWDRAVAGGSAGVEQIWARYKEPQTGEWRWRMTSEAIHGLPFCPVYWMPNTSTEGRHDGRPDLAGGEGEVDEANELFAAAGITTKRNADDTLVMKMDPSNKPGGRVRKGGYNIIYSTGGAEYLSQDGASATICVELSERRAKHVYRRAGLDWVDLETRGTAASGEALKRIFSKTIATAASQRGAVAGGLIEPLCIGILDASRILLARRMTFAYPPRVEKTAEDTVVHLRLPGRSRHVECVWPTPFPPTQQDKQTAIGAGAAGVAGGTLSRRTAIVMAEQAGVPIPNVDDELAAIEEDAKAAADRQAAMMGTMEPGPGRAGPIPDGPSANDGATKSDEDEELERGASAAE